MYDKLSFLVRKDAVLKKEEFAYKKVDDVKLSDAKIFLIRRKTDLQLMRFRISLKMMI